MVHMDVAVIVLSVERRTFHLHHRLDGRNSRSSFLGSCHGTFIGVGDGVVHFVELYFP